MQYAIELYYDKSKEKKLFDLVQRVADEKLSTKFLEWKTRPHLTLECFNDVHEFKKIYGEFVALGLVKILFPVNEIYTIGLCEQIGFYGVF